jgi:hypothetical protein
MKKLICLTAVSALVVLAVPNLAAAGSPTLHAAKQACKQERLEEPGEFARVYGTGRAAIRACARDERREARRDCREDRVEEPAEFKRLYGTGGKAMKRCIVAELRDS